MFNTPFTFLKAAGGAGGWTPADLPGIYLWLQATDGITTSGGLVTSWVDKISSKTFSSATTAKFTYTSSDATFNNKPSLFWDKSQPLNTPPCILSNNSIAYGGEDLFYWGVYSFPTSMATFVESMMFNIAGGSIAYQTLFFGAGPQKAEFLVLGSGSRNTSAFAVTKDVPRLFIGRRKNSSPFTNSLWDNRSTAQSLDQAGTLTAATLTGVIGNETVGSAGYQYQFGGKIAEMGWCKATISDGDVSSLITYLTARYNITLQ